MRIVNVELPAHPYPILIGRQARGALPDLLAGRRPIVIADQSVVALHWPAVQPLLPAKCVVLTVASGEASKSLSQAATLYDTLAANHIERGDVIVALGGGMIGDLAGFVAGTWMRGIAFIQAPTTLEAAIDASVGGKTAVNLSAGKNLVGVFHQPEAVLVDTAFLDTLPQRDYCAGLAESVKHGVVRDAAFLAWQETNVDALMRREAELLDELIARNCGIKADVVARDEREGGLRAVLNYGHTIGHAIEHLFEYDLRHGESVALGMRVENQIAARRSLLEPADVDRIARLLDQMGLPDQLPGPVADADVIRTCRLDKKSKGGTPRFVLPAGVGNHVVVADVADAEIRQALAVLRTAPAD
ncbi:MAG: 3-dehydroquinate synthase [Phycisphaerae bacterium]|nr:3-dehydroquinate synthase [Phycisphaerae bacterium]